MNRRAKPAAWCARLLACVLSAACGEPAAGLWLIVRGPEGRPAIDDLTLDPPLRVTRSVERPRDLAIRLEDGDLPAQVVLRAPGACPTTVPLNGRVDAIEVLLEPWITTEPFVAQVGYDREAELAVTPGCREALGGTIEWTHVGGAALARMESRQNGFRLVARTQPRVETPAPWGVVPISAHGQAATTLEATWRGQDAPSAHVRVRIAAAARASGMPAVGLGQRIYLGGAGWHVVERPEGSSTHMRFDSTLTSLLVDRGGQWHLRDGAGHDLQLRVGRHDETPLDCGRSECHQSVSATARASPMTTVLQRGMDGTFADDRPGCALACHAVGEPGVPDGGFVHVTRLLGSNVRTELSVGGWSRLRRALRRAGGVGCTACHGPGAIPEPSARWTILRTAVCAVCHDQPPRYGHVRAWNATRMSRADEREETRKEASCRVCHTTAGFLYATGALPDERLLPSHAAPIGIACAACHDPHGAEIAPRLVRRVAVPEVLASDPPPGVATRICLPCHSPGSAEPLPLASEAALWLGRGGLDPQSGARLAAAPPDNLDRGCLSCHDGGPAGIERGLAHGFMARAASQPEFLAAQALLGAQAAELWRTLLERGAVRDRSPAGPNAAHGHATLAVARDSALGRAAWNVALVLRDRAAAAHNAEYARTLLAASEAALAGP